MEKYEEYGKMLPMTRRFIDKLRAMPMGRQVAVLLIIMERWNEKYFKPQYKAEFCTLLEKKIRHCWLWLGHEPGMGKEVREIITLIHYVPSPFDDSVDDFSIECEQKNMELCDAGMSTLMFLGYISSQVEVVDSEAADLDFSMLGMDLEHILTLEDWKLLEPSQST